MLNLRNPIPKTMKDKEQLTAFYQKYGIIPYYGDNASTSHGFLDLLSTLTSLSPSFVSCMRDISAYTFGRNVDIVGRSITGLSGETVDLDFGLKKQYVDFLKNKNISLVNLIKINKRVLRYLKDCGNAYIVIKRFQVGDAVKYDISTPHYKHCGYMSSKDENIDFIIVSKFLNDDRAEELMSKYPPIVAPVTKNGEQLQWCNNGDCEVAIVHILNENHNDESDYYGRPDIIAVLPWLFTDYENGNLNSKIAATEIISKKILAFEAPDPNTIDETEMPDEDFIEISASGDIGAKKNKGDYFTRNIMTLRSIATNMGGHDKTSAVGAIEYPHGGRPPIELGIEVNRDTTHHSWQLEMANVAICANMQWSAELVNLRQTKGGIGGNILFDLFSIKNETTIQPLQRELEDVTNNILSQICEREQGDRQFVEFGIQFPNVIDSMIDKYKMKSNSIINPINQADEVDN